MLAYRPLTLLLQGDNGRLESVQQVRRRRHKRKNNVPGGCCMYVRTEEGRNKGVMPGGADMNQDAAQLTARLAGR
jgi:hypothetical protein